MSLTLHASRALWSKYVQLLEWYHRFEVVGDLAPLRRTSPALIVGYHGRPWPYDLWILQRKLLKDFGQRSFWVIEDRSLWKMLRHSAAAMDLLLVDDTDGIDRAIQRGDKLIFTPGSLNEPGRRCWRSEELYRVDWRLSGQHADGEETQVPFYLELASKHRLPIVPVAAAGVDQAYVGLNDGYAWARRLRFARQVGPWFGLGLGGLWPLALPLPVKIKQCVGEALDLFAHRESRATELIAHALSPAAHHAVATAVQEQLDLALGRRHGARSTAVRGAELVDHQTRDTATG